MVAVLNNPVLVLNRGWNAIDATSVREAIVDVMANKAHFLHPQNYTCHDMTSWMGQEILDDRAFVQTANVRFLVPEVIINRYSAMPIRTVVFSRRNLWKRDGYVCQYCGCKPQHDDITIDHVIPKAIWNRQHHEKSVTCFENCVLACVNCNKKKNNRTPEQADMRLHRMVKKNNVWTVEYYVRPVTPKWNPIYSIRNFAHYPKSWSQFLKVQNDELYWNVELED
jgi:hypothetical protein